MWTLIFFQSLQGLVDDKLLKILILLARLAVTSGWLFDKHNEVLIDNTGLTSTNSVRMGYGGSIVGAL